MLQFQYVWTVKLNWPISNSLNGFVLLLLARSLLWNCLKERHSAWKHHGIQCFVSVSPRVWCCLSGQRVAMALGVCLLASSIAPGLGQASLQLGHECMGLASTATHQSLCCLADFPVLSHGCCQELWSVLHLTFVVGHKPVGFRKFIQFLFFLSPTFCFFCSPLKPLISDLHLFYSFLSLDSLHTKANAYMP
jgi:hypothetical protein